MNSVDESLLQTLNIVPIAGRLFSKDFPSDDQGIILNEESIDELGFKSPQDAIGRRVNVLWASQTYVIIGVVRDFHFRDLHIAIAPYAFLLHSDTIHNNYTDYNYLIVHARTNNVSSLLKSIAKNWHKLNPNEPFEYSFLDEGFQKNYASDDRLFSIVTFFTVVAILISCLGLFGLAAFSAEQRKKEIGVRKVLGASVTEIVILLIKDLLWLVAIAIPIASPIGWFVMDKWLQNFAYRTSVSWTVLVISSMMAMLVAVITTCFQAMKAAGANPVNSLRTEQ
jgi:putative ABC transport system permease protein